MEIFKISVLIPTYNEEKFILKCLNSLYAQTFGIDNINIFVIDGRSLDRTRELVNKEQYSHPNIILLDNPKKIQSAAFNIGFSNSNDDIIIRLDAHAYYDKEYIFLCVNNLYNNQEFGNVGGRLIIEPSNDTLIANANALLNSMKFAIGGADYRVGVKAKEVETVPFGAFPRHVIEEVGGMNEELPRGEDNEYNSRIRSKGYKIFFDPKIICIYYARPTYKTSVSQMYNNGYSIGVLLRRSIHFVSYRHVIPLLFLLFLIFGAIFSLFIHQFSYFYFVILLTYSILNILSSIVTAIKNNKFKCILILPFLLFSIHVSYGVGTINGLIISKYK